MSLEPATVALSLLGSLCLWTILHFVFRVLHSYGGCGWLLNTKAAHTAFVLIQVLIFYYYCTRSEISNGLSHTYTDLLVVSAGFNVYHMSQELNRPAIILHHFCTVTLLSYVLCNGSTADWTVGNLAVFILAGSVLTEPLIYFRRALKRIGVSSTDVRESIGWIFFAAFSVVRITWIVKTVRYFLSPEADYFIVAFLAVIMVLSVYFCCCLFHMAKKKKL